MSCFHIVRFHLALVAALFLSWSTGTLGGQLDDFESAATDQRYESDTRADPPRHGDDNDRGFWADFFFEIFDEIFSAGARLSLARIDGSTEPGYGDVDRREIGSPDLPFLRFDMNYQHMESGIDALDGRLEVGYGPFGVEYRRTRFTEEQPRDTMDLSYLRGLYRVSGSKHFEFGIGLGAVELQGNERNSGLSTALPINVYPHPDLGLRLAPSWSWINGNPINDLDGSVAYVRKYFSVRVGYRRIQSHGEVLRGPYAGASLHY